MTAHFRCLDLQFSVTTESPEDTGHLEAVLGSFAAPHDESEGLDLVRYDLRKIDGRHALLVDGQPVRVADDPVQPLEVLLWDVAGRTVRNRGDRVILHSAVMRAPGGAVLLLPGPSGSGKSTTAYGLSKAGWDYLSDEFAVLDPATFAVTPFRRPIGLKTGTRRLLPQVDAESILVPSGSSSTAHVVADPGEPPRGSVDRPTFVVFPTYEHGAATEITALPASHTCLRLLENVFGLRETPGVMLPAMRRLALGVAGFQMTIGDLDAAVAQLSELAHGRNGQRGSERTAPARVTGSTSGS